MSVHWLPPAASFVAGEVTRAACGAQLEQNRPDYREAPDLVGCNQCRWAWLVYVIRCVFTALVPLGVQRPRGV